MNSDPQLHKNWAVIGGKLLEWLRDNRKDLFRVLDKSDNHMEVTEVFDSLGQLRHYHVKFTTKFDDGIEILEFCLDPHFVSLNPYTEAS